MTLPLRLCRGTCVSAHLEHASTSAKSTAGDVERVERMLTFLLPSCRLDMRPQLTMFVRQTVPLMAASWRLPHAQGRYQVVRQDVVARGQGDCNEEVTSKGGMAYILLCLYCRNPAFSVESVLAQIH